MKRDLYICYSCIKNPNLRRNFKRTSTLFGHDFGLMFSAAGCLSSCNLRSSGSVFGLDKTFFVCLDDEICFKVLSLCSEITIFTRFKSRLRLIVERLGGTRDSFDVTEREDMILLRRKFIR